MLATSLMPTAALATVADTATTQADTASTTIAEDAQDEALEQPVDEAGTSADAVEAVEAAEPSSTDVESVVETTIAAIEAESVSGSLSDIDYVYIDQDSVSQAESQFVLVGLDPTISNFTEASLTVSSPNGALFEKSAKASTDSAVLFEFEGGSLAQGKYTIANLLLNTPYNKVVYDFTTDAVEYSFEVTSSNNSIESALADGGIYTVDNSGNVVEQKTVEGALQTAGAIGGNGSKAKYSTAAPLVVLLDPGHGGNDPGASANGLVEKTLNLKIALACRDELSSYKGVTVRMTRDKDATVDLATRAQMARDYGATVIIGIHNDSAGEAAHGSSVIIPLNGREHAIGDELGKEILKQLERLGLYNRGTWGKAGNEGDYYYLIREPKKDGIAGIIIEHAFLTNADDAKFLADDANLRKAGISDATAIASYYGLSFDESVYYAPVYNYDYYIANNKDVANACGGSRAAAIQHFMSYGMNEGRKSSPNFDIESYYNRYSDLRNAFGFNLAAYYQHYVNHGRHEGRNPTGTSEIVDYASTQNGKNYAPVYDGSTYRKKYEDLDKAFTVQIGVVSLFSDKDLLAHFLNHGMNEGRVASDRFSPSSYYNQYYDLRRAFGDNLKNYYEHYIDHGLNEGRSAAAGQPMKNFITMSGDIDYSPVYDGSYYWNNHEDLRNVFQHNIGDFTLIDECALLEHFKTYGMREARRASASFDVDCYYKTYPDLRKAFGTSDWSRYYLHYIEWGCGEGRVAVDQTNTVTDSYSAIMGNSQVTAAQMAKRYKISGKSYPSNVYAQYGAPDIDTFCNIIYQEANAEGVRAEIVFAQAMHETGWLQFGGDVAPEQCNFAGIGATGGVPGNSFNDNGANSVRIGLRAQVQHLKAYASTAKLNNPCVDPRFNFVQRGCAPSVYDLSGRWATGPGYGDKVMALVNSIIVL